MRQAALEEFALLLNLGGERLFKIRSLRRWTSRNECQPREGSQRCASRARWMHNFARVKLTAAPNARPRIAGETVNARANSRSPIARFDIWPPGADFAGGNVRKLELVPAQADPTAVLTCVIARQDKLCWTRHMGTIEHFRDEARHCRKLAAEHPASRYVERWLALAYNYDQAADLAEKRFSTALAGLIGSRRVQSAARKSSI
jgi:hypothetical protein